MSERAAPRRSRSGSDTRQRSERRTYRFTPAELAKLDADARAAGLTEPSYIRHLLTEGKAPRAVRRPPVELEALRILLGELGQLRAELGKVGSNLNQIAHKLNAEQPVTTGYVRETLQRLDQAFLALQAKRDAALAALGYEVAE